MLLLVAGALVGAPAASGAAVAGIDVTYTTDADFDKGTLVNVNHDAPNSNQLQLNRTSGTFPFIWVALSQRCTIAKIDTATGQVLGEYRTLPDGGGVHCFAESSRTTVAVDGSVWVGHRGLPRISHVGLAELNQCVDRDGSGTIETSTGYGDVKPWPGPLGTGVSQAQDECIIHHVDPQPGAGGDSRHMSIDADGNLWVGNFSGGSVFHKIDGATGAVLAGPFDWACGGYGGFVDKQGVIWSATSSSSLLRWDPGAPVVSPNGSSSASNPRCMPVPNYGLALDAAGSVWVTELGGPSVRKVSADGISVQTFPKGPGSSPWAQGIAVDGNGDVWISSSLFCSSGCTVTHLRNDGTFVGNVPTPTGSGSTGVSVDATGKVWTANRGSHTATRIDPTANGGVGAVDLTVSFPAGPDGRPLPYPYNYSDMTGAQLISNTAPQGTWTVVQDSGVTGHEWGTVTWNTEPAALVPAGSSITVEARTANTEAGLGSASYAPVASGTPFVMSGRFIQVRVKLLPTDTGDSPVLSDLRISSEPDNAQPVVEAGGPYTGVEGAPVSIAGTVTDPDPGDTVTRLWSAVPGAGVDPGATCAFTDPASVATTVTCTDDGVWALTLTADDGVNPPVPATTPLTLANADPVITSVVVPTAPVALGTPVTVTAPFTDQGANDTHTWQISWGDAAAPSTGAGVVSASHTYASPGVYTVAVTVTDDDGGTDTETVAAYVVVYDPSGGFVTGGGWIDSPAGAYAPDPTLTGRANFGFVAKYKKGATAPEGSTEFQFQTARLNFHSRDYEWLVVSGPKAQYKGSGTINGAGDYGFLLTANDGQVAGGGGVDRLRVKIWDRATGSVVYDNQGGADSSAAADAIEGGSVVIHAPKK